MADANPQAEILLQKQSRTWNSETTSPGGSNCNVHLDREPGRRSLALVPVWMTAIRILVADDHPVVRDGLVALLSTQSDFMVVGQASNGSELITNVEIARTRCGGTGSGDA